jgi:uncharacterized membrane protein
MDRIIEKIKVNVPVRTAYNQWTQFEEFPKFMDHVESVRQLDDTHLHWTANVGGKTFEWVSEIVEQVPDQRIAWRSTAGHKHAGTVEFRALSDNRTEVILVIAYEPEGPLEHVGDALGVTKRRVMVDLERFRKFMEARGVETGAWRGEVQRDEIGTRHP